jgi:hypothetical protein
MEEFLVTDFLINGSTATDDLQMFDAKDFTMENDYMGLDSTHSSSEVHSASSPFDEDLQMGDAQEWASTLTPQVVRPPSPSRVLAVQTQVNEIVKVKEEDSSPSEPEPKNKKRRRDSDEDVSDAIPEGLAAVFLKREQLLTISSVEHEAFVQRIANFRDLSDAELKEVKRQRRLIKNREYAQTSRQKKKVNMGHVKEQVNSLESENDDLKLEVTRMRSRIMELELENASLRVQLSKEQTSSSDDSTDAVVDFDVPTASRTSQFSRSPFSLRPTMAVSVLFVFLFAFGFLFNSPLFNAAFSSSQPLPGSRNIAFHTGRTIFTVEPTSQVSYDPSFSDPNAMHSESSESFTNVSNDLLDACFDAVNNTC